MPSVWLSVCSATLVLAAAACGADETAPQPPKLGPVVAERLAARSEAIADAIERGDDCSAARDLERLGAELRASQVPVAIRREAQRVLEGTSLVCLERQPPPVTATTDEGEDDNGKDKGKKKDKKHGHGDDEEDDD